MNYSEIDFTSNNSKNFNDIENINKKEYNSISNGILDYGFDINRFKSDNNVFSVDPNIRTQKLGYEPAPSMIDYSSSMLNMDRKLNKDLYINPIDPKSDQLKFNDGFINKESTRLNNPTLDLKGLGPNRFYKLLRNPQENVIEPFSRIGENTVQTTLDKFKK